MNSLLEVGLGNALTSLALAPIAAWVGRGGRRPALAHGLWLLVLLKLVTPPLWTWSVPIPASVRASAPAPVEVAGDLELLEFVFVEDESLVRGDHPLDESVVPSAPVEIEVPAPAPAPVAWTPPVWSRSALAWTWGLGTFAWLAVTGSRLRRFRGLLNEARPASYETQAMSDALAARIGLANPPEVSTLPGPISPFVWCLGGPARLLLPSSLWESLGHDQRATLLTHELAHLKRRDHWVRGLELVATALFWWHPVVYWARRGLREAEEQCCDAWVVWAWPKAAKAYATALLETVDFIAEARPSSTLPVAASGLGHVEHPKRRLTMILSGLTPHRLSFAGRIALAGLAAALLPLAPSIAGGDKPEPTAPALALLGPDATPFAFVFDDDKDDDDDDDDKKSDKDKKKVEEKRIEVRVKAAKELAEKARADAMKAREEALGAQKKAMEEHKKALESHAKAFLFVSPDGAAAGPKKEATKEEKAALEKARAEMKELGAAMEKAAKRLAELEMKVNGRPGLHTFSTTVRAQELRLDGKDGRVMLFKSGDGGPLPKEALDKLPAEIREKLGKPGATGTIRVEVKDGKATIHRDGEAAKEVRGKPGADVREIVIGKKADGETFEIKTDDVKGADGRVRVFGRVIQRDGSGDKAPGEVRVFEVRPPVPPAPPAPPAAPGAKDQGKRIEALERQIEALLREMRELKREGNSRQAEGNRR